MEPEILSQVNNSCPPGQTVTIPGGDSLMDAAIIYHGLNIKTLLTVLHLCMFYKKKYRNLPSLKHKSVAKILIKNWYISDMQSVAMKCLDTNKRMTLIVSGIAKHTAT